MQKVGSFCALPGQKEKDDLLEPCSGRRLYDRYRIFNLKQVVQQKRENISIMILQNYKAKKYKISRIVDTY